MKSTRLLHLALRSALAVALSSAACAQTQGSLPLPPHTEALSPDKQSATNKPIPSPVKPLWKELTPRQQTALSPLAERWDSLDLLRKRKWLEIAANYRSLPPAEQAKLHARMTEWVTLSRQERAQARLNYVETRKLSPAEKAVQWQAYQELSKEEKNRLAARAPAKVGVASVKPTSPEKVAKVPVSPEGRQPIIPTTPKAQTLHRHTLLPQMQTAELTEEPAATQSE